MSNDILAVEGLTKRYGGRLAVNNLSFSVQRGDLYGFLGRNGAGKSTTIRMILGLVWPTAGKIIVAGRSIESGRHRHPWPVGAIVESPVFYDYLSARTNLEILSSLSHGASKARIDEILELVNLTERQHEKVSVYSHGMRQRLGLAQALLPNPELIILDEPLDGLDPNGIRHLRDVMLNVVREQKVTIFLSSHILSEVEMTCNRVVVIHKGQKLFEGATHDLMHDANRVRLRARGERNPAEIMRRLSFVEKCEAADDCWIVTLGSDSIPALNRELVMAQVDVMELSPMKNRLEDVFIGLTEQASGEAPGSST